MIEGIGSFLGFEVLEASKHPPLGLPSFESGFGAFSTGSLPSLFQNLEVSKGDLPIFGTFLCLEDLDDLYFLSFLCFELLELFEDLFLLL